MTGQLVIVRHGQSTANRDNQFTGWTDVPLTPRGREQAVAVGRTLLANSYRFSAAHTSVLQRAITTCNIILAELDQLWLPVHKTWRLNERHYGSLRGQNKTRARAVFGVANVALWRRSYTAAPPAIPVTERNRDRRYCGIFEPGAESLADATHRLLPYWQEVIAPALRAGEDQLVVAHGSTLRALAKFLEHIADDAIDGLEIANGEPMVYTFSDDLRHAQRAILPLTDNRG